MGKKLRLAHEPMVAKMAPCFPTGLLSIFTITTTNISLWSKGNKHDNGYGLSYFYKLFWSFDGHSCSIFDQRVGLLLQGVDTYLASHVIGSIFHLWGAVSGLIMVNL